MWHHRKLTCLGSPRRPPAPVAVPDLARFTPLLNAFSEAAALGTLAA
eukprot:CAMPEP_0185206594 /NCGR_PEP_ID=MMETSP1140-20130426/58781_1 /TAXON_ID=298111 /ORGANISM="Pavlova sp., Strain CCMP459" /LENGTH=46 /DNA_ID= /DNA_START= /DNA_END= /DNA_ORIENTATION=